MTLSIGNEASDFATHPTQGEFRLHDRPDDSLGFGSAICDAEAKGRLPSGWTALTPHLRGIPRPKV